MAATIKDVAKVAGCSIKTVSRVINNEPHVTEEIRVRVQNAIRVVGYSPNLAARRLVLQKAYMICLLMYPGFYQPASALLSRIMDIGYSENYDILIEPYYPTHKTSKDRLANMVTARRFDGFVTTPPCDMDGFVADLLITYKIPVVQINPLDRSKNIPYIAGNDYQDACLLTQHLIGLGHRRISFLNGPRNMRSSLDRLHGYRDTLARHGIPYDPALIGNSEFNFDGGYTAAQILLKSPHPPSAIYAGSDEAAYGVIYAAQEMGVQIPAQLSVCGHDDLIFSKTIWPGLTTIHQPIDEITEQAVLLLIDILKGNPPDPLQIILPSRLIVRGSTAKAA